MEGQMLASNYQVSPSSCCGVSILITADFSPSCLFSDPLTVNTQPANWLKMGTRLS